jgi:hypothetical protein
VAGLDVGRLLGRWLQAETDRTFDGFCYFKTEFLVESDCFCVGNLRVNQERRQKTKVKALGTKVIST